jgi:hypothetical protein
VARMTISVPEDLQKRMRRVKDINWSGVAAAAFDVQLAEIEKMLKQQRVKAILKKRSLQAPSAAELDEIKDRRSHFLEQLGYQADWRDEKASEYPDDVRNKRSEESLRQLVDHLGNLPPNDSLWVRYSRVWDDGEGNTNLVEYEHEALRTFGFYAGPAEDISAKDAVEFLRDLVEELERVVAESMIED